MSLSSVPKHHSPRQSTAHTRSAFLVMLTMPLCTLLLLAGCSARAGIASLQDVARDGSLQPGISTKKDVYQRLGQPVDVLPAQDGSTWLYAQAGSPVGDSSRAARRLRSPLPPCTLMPGTSISGSTPARPPCPAAREWHGWNAPR